MFEVKSYPPHVKRWVTRVHCYDWFPYPTGTTATTHFLMRLIDTFWYLLIYLSKYLGQETAKWPFWSSSQAAI